MLELYLCMGIHFRRIETISYHIDLLNKQLYWIFRTYLFVFKFVYVLYTLTIFLEI